MRARNRNRNANCNWCQTPIYSINNIQYFEFTLYLLLFSEEIIPVLEITNSANDFYIEYCKFLFYVPIFMKFLKEYNTAVKMQLFKRNLLKF